VVEILFAQAVERAKQLDDYFATYGKTLGPLHGIPMTLKDQFNVRGYDTTLGYVGRAFKPASDDADLVKTLEDAGVVFLAKTNLPQSIMASRWVA
jgi:amidase